MAENQDILETLTTASAGIESANTSLTDLVADVKHLTDLATKPAPDLAEIRAAAIALNEKTSALATAMATLAAQTTVPVVEPPVEPAP